MTGEQSELEQLPRDVLVERARALQTVLRVAEEATLAGSLTQLAERFVAAVAAYTRFPAVVVMRYVPGADGFDLLAQHGFDESKFPKTQRMAAKSSLTGLAAQRRHLLTTEDIEHDDRVDPDVRAALTKNAYTSGACVPIIQSDEILGSFNLIYPRGTALEEGERAMLGALANNLGVAMAQRIAVERELALEHQAHRAQQIESLGLLAAGIAHDFNNLLMGLLGNIEMAKELTAEGDAAEGMVQLAEALTAGERARALTKQLLTFSRGGEPSLQVVDDLEELIKEVASFAARGRSVRCDVELQGPLGLVKIDRGQISQVVQNLVINACQASESGGLVLVRARRTHQESSQPCVVLEVTDRGSGIPSQQLPRIFEPFFSARPGGTGLGLSVSHSIVQRHGGELLVQSEVGRGTTFTMILPAFAGTATPAVPRPREIGRFDGRALVMDDDEQVRRIAQRMLKRIGFASDSAAHGGAALRLAKEAQQDGTPYRVALLDLTVVGGLGGADIAEELRRLSPGTRLIVASGYAEQVETGWDGRLQKPYSLSDLSSVLEGTLMER